MDGRVIIRVSGVVRMEYQHNNQQKNKTKYYQPQQNKQVIKQDFGILLDKEIEKLHFEKII